MGHTDEIKYHLPISCLRVTGTVTHTYDSILDKTETAPTASVALDVIADEAKLTAKIESGWLRDTNVSFELTDDGRLVSSSVESTGEAGKALLGVVTVGGAIAGAVIGLPPGAVGAIAAAAGLGAAKVVDHKELIDRARKPEKDPVAKAYEKAYPGVFELKTKYAELVAELLRGAAVATEEFTNADTDLSRRAALTRVRDYRQALELARAESEHLDAHYKAWRATTFKSRSEAFEYLLTLDALRKAGAKVESGTVTFADSGDPEIQEVKKVWANLGAVVVISGAGSDTTVEQPSGENKILVRLPRRVTLALYKKGEAGKPDEGRAVLVETKSYLVMDGLCGLETFAFRKSLWAKRSSALKFSGSGALTGFSSTAASTAAALAEAAQGAPAALAGGLEQSKKIYDQLDALRSRSLDQRLARLKKEVELKQQEIAQAGLLATQGSTSELERLKQEAEILEKRKTIAGYDEPLADGAATELAGIERQVELLTARQALAAAQRALESDSEHADLWQEIERLRAEREQADLEHPAR
jgi:hypothetical protein